MPLPQLTPVANFGGPLIPRLDLVDFVGQRSATFKFSYFDSTTGRLKGELHPLRQPAASISHDTTRTIVRTGSLSLGVDDSELLDPITDRIDIAMILGGIEYPLGRYIVVDATRSQWTSGDITDIRLADEMFVVDQPMTEGFSSTASVPDAIRALLQDFDFEIDIEASGFTAAGSWPAGTSTARVLAELCTQGGFFAPWFDNLGTLQIIRAFDPADADVVIDFDAGNQVVRGTVARTSDLLTAPNRFVVISNGHTGGENDSANVGVYDIPASAPHSIANRGFVIAKVVDMQLTSDEQAQAAAEKLGQSSNAFEQLSLTTPPDPRHDSYDVHIWKDERWLETAWAMTLLEGGAMSHTMRRAYS